MAQDYNRLQRSDWNKLGAAALARELFSILNTAPITKPVTASDGFYIKFNESGSGADYAVNLQAGGVGWDFGTVVEGSGTTYIVQLNAGNKITATVPRILVTDEQEIPADAKVVVVKLSDGTYRLIWAAWVVQSTS